MQIERSEHPRLYRQRRWWNQRCEASQSKNRKQSAASMAGVESNLTLQGDELHTFKTKACSWRFLTPANPGICSIDAIFDFMKVGKAANANLQQVNGCQ